MSSSSVSSAAKPQQQLQQQTARFTSSAGNAPKHRRPSSKGNGNNNNNSNNNNNNSRRSVSAESIKQSKLSPLEQEIISKHMDDRTLYLLSNSIGSKCIVTVTSGTRYTGLLYSTSSFTNDNNLSIVLKMPELYSLSPDDEFDPNDELPDIMVFENKDFNDIEILNLDLSFVSKSPVEATTSFKTDVDISANRKLTQERELEKWEPEEIDSSILDGGLEDDMSANKNWDQFAVNEKKFGIQSSFDEEMYTTKISKDDPKYKERLEQAEKLAREIEGSSYNGNIHLAEERGVVVDDSGLDEEDKYSGVDRRGEELMAAIKSGKVSNSKATPQRDISPNKYVPPTRRAVQYHDDPAVLASSLVPKKLEDKKKVPATLPHKPSLATVKPPLQGFSSETSRINAQSEINALKEFSANFKVPSKFPKDLLPILTKDKSKQEELTRKFEEEEEAAKKAELEKKQKEKELAAPLPKKKMDPKKAITFKMNPNTASFQPSNFVPPLTIRSNFVNKSPVPMHSSPRINQVSPSRKNITPLGFFGARVPKEVKSGEGFKELFNLFIHIEDEKNLEKPFATPPTWEQEIDDSYITLYLLVPEKTTMTLPPIPNMRYYPPTLSPMGAPPQLIPLAVAPLSPSTHHHSQSPIAMQAGIHPQLVPIMMPPLFSPRDESATPQVIPPYYTGFMPNSGPTMVPPPPRQQQQPGTSPRQHRHHQNNNNNNNNNHHHHQNNNNNNYYNSQQQLQQGQYPMMIPMPMQQGQYPRGAPITNPAVAYYFVGPPNGNGNGSGGRQF